MKRSIALPLLTAGLCLMPALGQAQTLPLTGPAYVIANEAYSAYERKDYDLAIAKAREALRQRPDIVRLNQLIELAQQDKYRRDHPLPKPLPVVQARPKPGFAAAAKALEAYDRGEFNAATDAARQAVTQAPENLDYRLLLIETLQRQQHLPEAEQASNDAQQALGNVPALRVRYESIQRHMAVQAAAQGYAALGRQDYNAAVVYAKDAVQRFPRDPTYRRLLVSAQTAQGELPEALSSANAGLAFTENDATLLVQRGHLRKRLGDRAGARQDFTQALAVGNLSTEEQASLYAALGNYQMARERLQQARQAGAITSTGELELAYLLLEAGDFPAAQAAFAQADGQTPLPPRATQDAAYTALRTGDDAQAISYFKRAVGELPMTDQQLFDTRRAVADVSRDRGLTSTTSYRGNSSINGLNGAPSSNTDNLQNSTEAFWRPLGYRNARFVELYGRVTDTLWSKEDNTDTGGKALQGTLGVRVKPFTQVNIMAALERSFPLGSSNIDGDWLLRLGYGASLGTDLRVDTPSWWTSQLYAESGHYLDASRTYFNSEWQIGRSYVIGQPGSRWVTFPHLVAAADYNSKMFGETDAGKHTRYSSGNSGGIGLGNNLRFWFREGTYTAPQSYLDLSLQYRARVFGDESAQGVFARLSYSY
ncbi:NfrA family protein [Pseudomonas fluorescens]|uniref:Bacteriophage N4 adsorption protein A C-terminal domain-containing protein n=1 Tax=Pseudomonas fluorescens TaxID=294 RepID=A0A5E7EW72_PSEFL|nr:tetratricopeptide repeat protein [Pseudomonas fluorescens]VVO31056.1 hypothetical protein PS723_04995 [Pseudomonas fluorescens]